MFVWRGLQQMKMLGERMEADEGREDLSDRGIKTWIMSVMEMVTFKVLR
jgi:hypothetical protein